MVRRLTALQQSSAISPSYNHNLASECALPISSELSEALPIRFRDQSEPVGQLVPWNADELVVDERVLRQPRLLEVQHPVPFPERRLLACAFVAYEAIRLPAFNEHGTVLRMDPVLEWQRFRHPELPSMRAAAILSGASAQIQMRHLLIPRPYIRRSHPLHILDPIRRQ